MKTSFLKIIFTLIFFLLPFLPSVVSAGTQHNVSGWGWSSNIGWISFNSITSGGAVDYGVHRASDGRLCGNDTCSGPTGIGYAWSSSIGWIQFGGLSGFPASGGNASVSSTGVVTGWAKALSADGNGWDGWISLGGTATDGGSYKVIFTNTGSTSYDCGTDCVWGSDVVGWVDFSGVVVDATTHTVTPSVVGSGTISPSTVQTVNSGSASTFTIDATGASLSYSIGGTCPIGSANANGGASPTSYTTGPITANCTVIASFSTGGSGSCPIPPMKHYECNVGGVITNSGGNQRSGPTKWTWTCGTNTCSENKQPGYEED